MLPLGNFEFVSYVRCHLVNEPLLIAFNNPYGN